MKSFINNEQIFNKIWQLLYKNIIKSMKKLKSQFSRTVTITTSASEEKTGEIKMFIINNVQFNMGNRKNKLELSTILKI